MSSAPQKPDNTLRMVLQSSFSELEAAIDKTQGFFSEIVDDEEFLYKIVLLASEAMTNAMEHGNGLDASKNVTVDLVEKSDSLEIWVEDEGDGFDRTSVADPLADEHLLDEGGRGLFLIEQLADDVRYELNGRRLGILFRK